MSLPKESKRVLRVVVIGDANVGKTSLLNRLMNNSFDEDCVSTIGRQFLRKTVEKDGQPLDITFWDTAGSERHASFIPDLFRTANVILLVYAINSSDSFGSLNAWMKLIEDKAPAQIPIIVCGNKGDIEDSRAVQFTEGQEYAQQINAFGFFECSAKSGQSSDLLMEKIVAIPATLIEDNLSIAEPKKKCDC